MNFRQINHDVMQNTYELCNSLESLKKAIADSISREYVVYQEDKIELPSLEANKNMKIIVSKERTYEAAEKYKGKKICCLDFANNHHIGGSPWTAGAQEESMCRTSTLYPCLEAKKSEFYDKHTQEFEEGKIGSMGSDDLIYIPDVVAFKTDVSIPEMKDESDWFKTNVIAAAAPVLGWSYDETKYKKIMEARIKRILDVAAKEKNQVLILGAFGCGAFHNPPDVVADIFTKLIKNYDFEIVEFAVFCRGDDTSNYDAFKSKFLA